MAPTSIASGRMRNYKAMGEEKLAACIVELRERRGDAYQRCMSGGSGDPQRDLLVAEAAYREKFGRVAA